MPLAEDTSGDLPSTLLDLGGVGLGELRAIDKSVLGTALQRILEEADRPQDAVAGFQSSV